MVWHLLCVRMVDTFILGCNVFTSTPGLSGKPMAHLNVPVAPLSLVTFLYFRSLVCGHLARDNQLADKVRDFMVDHQRIEFSGMNHLTIVINYTVRQLTAKIYTHTDVRFYASL